MKFPFIGFLDMAGDGMTNRWTDRGMGRRMDGWINNALPLTGDNKLGRGSLDDATNIITRLYD